MKRNLKHILFCLLMVFILNACAPTGKQLYLSPTRQSGMQINNEFNSVPGNDSLTAKSPIGFEGMNEENMIYEDAEAISGKFKTVSPIPQVIKSIHGVGIDSLTFDGEPVTDPLLIAGICAIGVGFLASPLLGIFSVLLELAGIGLIIASLFRINNHPEKYKGKKLATVLLIIIGIFTILGIISLVFLDNLF